MATVQERKTRHSDVTVLRRISYKDYCRLRENPANRHVRMTYNDGTLELVSPKLFEHEHPSARFLICVMAVASELGLGCIASATMTFRRSGGGRFKGKGKEPDQSFYIPNSGRILGQIAIDLDVGDPPPDLWIEVDNRASSEGRPPVYAGLGVPEVWRFDVPAKTLAFFKLVNDTYIPIDRSPSLPMLTPSLVLEALALGEGIDDAAWDRRLREWIRGTLAIRAGGD